MAYVRPYDIEVSRAPVPDGIAARVAHLNAVGPMVRVELLRDDTGASFEVHLTRERFRELNLQVGEAVFASIRNPRTFSADYSI